MKFPIEVPTVQVLREEHIWCSGKRFYICFLITMHRLLVIPFKNKGAPMYFKRIRCLSVCLLNDLQLNSRYSKKSDLNK